MAWMTTVANYTPDGEGLAMADYRYSGLGAPLLPEALIAGEQVARQRKGALHGMTDYAKAHPGRAVVGAVAAYYMADKLGLVDMVKGFFRRR